MSGANKPGIGLIELLLAIALLGVVAAVIIPNLGTRGPKEIRERFIADLNFLTQFAWRNAMVSGTVQKIGFDLSKSRVSIQEGTQKYDDKGEQIFRDVKSSYFSTSLIIPAQLSFKNFYIQSFDEMSRAGFTQKTDEIWFFIVPEGLSQSVIINMVDTKDIIAGRGRQLSLVLNPFCAQFRKYDEFQSP